MSVPPQPVCAPVQPGAPAAQPGSRRAPLALLAVTAGALGIASSGIFVRLSQTGPIATGFWRGALALPGLALWAYLAGRGQSSPPVTDRSWDLRFLWAGLFFAGDLALWHESLLRTSIAASTLEANLAPILVTLAAWLLWRERPRPEFLLALLLAVAGVVLIVSPKLRGAGHALVGDVLGLATACFYAGYIMVVARLRTVHGAAVVMLWSTLVFTLVLLPPALTERFWPQDTHGWAVLVALALIAQVVGQGLIAYALAHLPTTFGAIALYVQPVAAAFYAWVLLGERLSAVQLAGALIVLGAIALARRSRPGGA